MSQEIAGTSQENTMGQTSRTENTPNISKLNDVLRLKSEGLSLRDIEKATGIPKSSVARLVKGVPLKNGDEGENSVNETPSAFENIAEEPEPNIPKGYTLSPSLSAAEWAELSKLTKPRLVALAGELKASLQSQALARRGNGDSRHYPSGDSASAESAFWTEMAKTERVERALRIRDRYSDKKGEHPADVKSLLEMFRMFAPKQPNELEIYRAGRQDEQKNLQTAVRTAETNMLDLKIEELQQNERLDNRRLDWEQLKWKASRDDQRPQAQTKDFVEIPKSESPLP